MENQNKKRMLQFSFDSATSTVLPKDYQPRGQDVICGRGGSWRHNGNKVFIKIIQGNLEQYSNAKKGRFGNKTNLVNEMIRFFRDGKILFVKLDKKTKSWFEIGDEQLFEKISHAFRDSFKKMELKRQQQEQEQQEQQQEEEGGEDEEEEEQQQQQQRKGTNDSTKNNLKKTKKMKRNKLSNLPKLKERKVAVTKPEYTNNFQSMTINKRSDNSVNSVNVASENINNIRCITNKLDNCISSSSVLSSSAAVVAAPAPASRAIDDDPSISLDNFETIFEKEAAPDVPCYINDNVNLLRVPTLSSNDVMRLLNDDILEKYVI